MSEHEREREDAAVVRAEEELLVDARTEVVGGVRAHKRVESEPVDELVSREVEEADVERAGPNENDSGEVETLPDGSVSIPVLEEELVVSKRLVVRERIVIRKRTVTEDQRIRAELRKERVDLETVGDVETDPDTA